MARISYTTYNFNRPSEIGENEFIELKALLHRDPNISLNNSGTGIVDTFKIELIILGAAAIGVLLTDVGVDWLEGIGGILAIIGLFSLFSFVPSFFSYLGFLGERSAFYKKLKNDILNSESYEEFRSKRKNSWNR